MASIARRIGFATTGILAGSFSGIFGFTAGYSAYEVAVHGENAQDLPSDFESRGMTAWEVANMSILYVITTATSIGGGVTGWKRAAAGVPFSVTKVMKFTAGGCVASMVFGAASLAVASNMITDPSAIVTRPMDGNGGNRY